MINCFGSQQLLVCFRRDPIQSIQVQGFCKARQLLCRQSIMPVEICDGEVEGNRLR